MSTKTKAHIQYRLLDGTVVPGASTPPDILAKPALIHWAWQQGRDGFDYRKTKDEKGDVGTLSHYMVLCDLKNNTPDVKEYSQIIIDQAETRLLKWWDWKKEHTLEPLFLETPMVSEKYRFGGTPDYVGYIDGKRVVKDIKTGNGIYDEYWYQIVAYGELVKCARLFGEDDNNLNNVSLNIFESIDEYILLWLSPDTKKKAEAKTLLDGSLYWRIFLDCLDIYNTRKRIRESD